MFVGTLIADAEIISIALEIFNELPWFRSKTCTIRLGHTKLLEGMLIHHGIDTKYHESIKKTLSEVKVSFRLINGLPLIPANDTNLNSFAYR